MNNENAIINTLKSKIKLKDYNSAIEILKKEITKEYVTKIQERDKNFKYSNILNLMSETRSLLSREYNITLKKYFIITNDECGVEYELHNLIEIYSKLKKGGISSEF
ncbi:MAG: hypothetical protein IKD77_04195 [Bacilli bacterium]|nr:hypothetical protein [Bacilli bacterium]